MLLRILLPIFLCHSLAEGQMSGSKIWSKDEQNFIDLYSDPRFSSFKEAVFEREQDLDARDINGKVVKVSYYEEKDFAMFYDNDTKVTGISGDIWNLLEEQLNFTLVPVKCKERDFGIRLENGSYTGLVGMLVRNEIHVIMRTGYYNFRAHLLDYTVPIWQTKYYLYIPPEFEYDSKWVITILTPQTWCVLIFLFVVLCLTGYIFQKEQKQVPRRKRHLKKTKKYFSLSDHVFYTHSIMCGQGYLPDDFHNQHKILSILKSMFAWLVLLTISSHLIYRMANRTIARPFKDFDTLLTKTDYDILAFRGSMVYESLQADINRPKYRQYIPRFHFVNKAPLMFRMACQHGQKFAMLESQDKIVSRNPGYCNLVPIGMSYFQTWIGFGLPKRFRYKNIIDKSILKLREVGLIEVLKERWLQLKTGRRERSPFKKIDIQHVYIVVIIPFIGVVLSLIVLTIEHILYRHRKKH